MKTLIKILILSIIVTACESSEAPIFDFENEAYTAVSFGTSTLEVTVPTDGITIPIEVLSTTTSDVDRSYNVSVDTSSSATGEDYSLGTVIIPAGSFVGSLDVTLNYDSLEDFVTNTLIINLDVPDGTPSFSDQIEISFVREFDITVFGCETLSLSIVFDSYASETTFDITSEDGAVVASGGPFSDGTAGLEFSEDYTLAPGCYTFTIYDSFGDGLSDGVNIGTYGLTCTAQSVVSYASGSGNFGGAASTDFCVVAEED